MIQITLSEDQLKAVHNASDGVVFVDKNGTIVAYAVQSEFTAEDLAEAKRRAASPGPWRTTTEVLERIQSAAAE